MNSLGDCDLNKRITDAQKVKFQKTDKKFLKSINLNNNNNCDVQATSFFSIKKMNFNQNNNVNSSQENMSSKSSKLKNQATKLAKSVFDSRKSSLDANVNNSDGNSRTTSNNSLSKEKVITTSKYEEIKNESYDSQSSPDKIKSPFANDLETLDVDQTNRWSMTNDSIKAFDSENEEIPLVSKKPAINHQKKKSSQSVVTITANTNPSLPINNAPSSYQANSTVNTLLLSANSKSLGEENEGFSQFETNF